MGLNGECVFGDFTSFHRSPKSFLETLMMAGPPESPWFWYHLTNYKFYPLELPCLLNRQYRQTKNQTYAVIFEKYNVRYDNANSHIARSATPSGVDTEDPVTNNSKNCIAVSIRDHWKVAYLEEDKILRLKNEDRNNDTIGGYLRCLCPLRPLIMCT